jgi:hypothetical protein
LNSFFKRIAAVIRAAFSAALRKRGVTRPRSPSASEDTQSTVAPQTMATKISDAQTHDMTAMDDGHVSEGSPPEVKTEASFAEPETSITDYPNTQLQSDSSESIKLAAHDNARGGFGFQRADEMMSELSATEPVSDTESAPHPIEMPESSQLSGESVTAEPEAMTDEKFPVLTATEQSAAAERISPGDIQTVPVRAMTIESEATIHGNPTEPLPPIGPASPIAQVSVHEFEQTEGSALKPMERRPSAVSAEPPALTGSPDETLQSKSVAGEGMTEVDRKDPETASPISFTKVPQEAPISEPNDWLGFSERPRSTSTADAETPPRSPTIDATAPADVYPTSTEEIAEKAPTPRRERTAAIAIDTSEYTGHGTESPLPGTYLQWNRLLADRFVRHAPHGQIHLAISPRALASIASEDRGERISPMAAEAHFVAAVREAYASHVLGSSARLKIFRRYAADGIPLCIGMLALSVLAAHKMHSDEISSGAAYYIRLAELLNVPRDAGDRPKDFRTLEFESLWTFFAEWVASSTPYSLVLPNADDQRRFIAYPLAHVPLRQLDLEKLPEFFDWAGYSPEKRVTPERIADDLRRWEQSYDRLSQAGKSALTDERSAAVLAQLTSEFRAWDGTVATTQGIRSVQEAKILLDAVMRRLGLFLLTPRREGFPAVFRTTQVELNAVDAWYEPIELGLEESGSILHGFTWVHEHNPNYVIRRLPSKAIVLAPNAEYSGFVSRPDLPQDTVCAVLCHDSVVDVVSAYLREICDSIPSSIAPRGFPSEWRLFQNVRAVRHTDNVPVDCEGLAVAAYVDIIPQGGLRLGSRWSWMLGSPPTILVEGRNGRPVYINEIEVAVDDHGYVNAMDLLHVAGTHTVRVGSVERTVRIVEPDLRPAGPAVRPSFAESGEPRHPVVLASGSWILIGRHPTLAQPVKSEGIRDSLVLCDFEPVWAIKVGAGRGAKAIQLSSSRVEASGKIGKTTESRQWTSAIYAAAIRHAELLSEVESASTGLQQHWSEYVAVARHLKRQWKGS